MSEGHVGPRTVMRGDPAQCWRYASVGLVIGLVVAPLGGLVVSANVPARGELATTSVLIYGCIALFASLHAIWWFLIPGRVSYACDGDTLWATRGERTLREIPCTQIRSMAMGGRHLSWPMVILTVFPPILPKLYLHLDDDQRGRSQHVSFPSILIWGKEPLRRAEVALAEAAGVKPAPPK